MTAFRSTCVEIDKDGKACGRMATHVVSVMGEPWGPQCARCTRFYNPKCVRPMTPELDATIAELQTPEGVARDEARQKATHEAACAKLLAVDAEARALKLLRDGRCGFCEAPVSLLEGFLEFASHRDGRLARPSDDDGWIPIAYLTHANCSPITGYWIPLDDVAPDRRVRGGSLSGKAWWCATFACGLTEAEALARRLTKATASATAAPAPTPKPHEPNAQRCGCRACIEKAERLMAATCGNCGRIVQTGRSCACGAT